MQHSDARRRAGRGPCGSLALALGLFFTAFLASTGVRAAGFAVAEQSASGLGTAFAGGAAVAEDSSTIFFNPAGMTRLQRHELSAGLHIITASSDFTNRGSTDLTSAPLSGPSTENGGSTALVPNLYGVWKINNDWWLGLGINAPFGLTTEYNAGWPGRYHTLLSELVTINVNPSAAYRVTDWLSLGAGINVQYVEAELSKAIDFGAACFGVLGAGPCTGLGLTPQAADGKATVKGDDISYGYNLGVLLTPRPDTRVGLAYRSKISHTLKGDATFTVPAAALPVALGTGAFVNTGGTSKVTMPEIASLSVHHDLTPDWAVMADVTWTHWSRFKTLAVTFDNPAQAADIQPENWTNTFRYALGVTHRPKERLVLRMGAAFDESPVPSRTRTPRIPDSDRYWLTFGAGYDMTEATRLDIGYMHVFFRDSTINQPSAVAGTLVGSYESSADVFSFQVTTRY